MLEHFAQRHQLEPHRKVATNMQPSALLQSPGDYEASASSLFSSGRVHSEPLEYAKIVKLETLAPKNESSTALSTLDQKESALDIGQNMVPALRLLHAGGRV